LEASLSACNSETVALIALTQAQTSCHRFTEKNLILNKCTKRYEKWVVSYRNYLLACPYENTKSTCDSLANEFEVKKLMYQDQLESNLKRATEIEDRQFTELIERVKVGTKIVEAKCPFGYK